jgi:hypothetical protein
VREDGVEVFKVLVQPTQEVQHNNTVGDIDVEVIEGVGEALHLLTVVVEAEVALNEALEGDINVEGMSFMGAEEVAFQGHPSIVSHLSTLPGDVLQVEGDGAVDPRLDDVVHPVQRWNIVVRGVHQHVVRERVMPEGEQYIVTPPSVVCGGEVQRD